MTNTGDGPDDLVGLSISGGVAHFPGLATEQVRRLSDLDPALVTELLAAAEASAFFTRPDPDRTAPVRPDARTYRVCLVHAGRSRQLTVLDPLDTPELAQLVRTVRRCL